jgi:hypothetical protein
MMETNSLLWNRPILGVALALELLAMAHAQEARCPTHKDKAPLSGVVLYDGPPEQKADLMPDISKGSGDHVYASWKVGYIFDKGRKLYLVCRFGNKIDDTSTVEVDAPVKSCVFRSHPGGKPAELICK